MSSSAAPLLVSPSDVSSKTSDTVILDATAFVPGSPRNPYQEYLTKHIPNARFLDLENIGGSANVPQKGQIYMMPSAVDFAAACGKLGITPNTHVILYDTHGIFSAPRALFMFRSFGHTRSSVLDGGLPRWISEGLPVDEGKVEVEGVKYEPVPVLNSDAVKNYDQIIANSRTDSSEPLTIFDARPPVRYSAGHIPNSINVPFPAFLQTHNTGDNSYATFLPKPNIREAFVGVVGEETASGVLNGTKPAITSCGGGVTAGMIWLGLQIASADENNGSGEAKVGLYDESWAGYAAREGSEILTGSGSA